MSLKKRQSRDEQSKFGSNKKIDIDFRLGDFNGFKADMYEEYLLHIDRYGVKQTTIDRINSEGNYRKTNCRWATQKLQQSNRNNNVIIKGKTKSQWAREIGITSQALHRRLKKGWGLEEALTLKKYSRAIDKQ